MKLIFMLILAQRFINSNVKMGFEIEFTKISVADRFSAAEPILQTDKWALFTDIGGGIEYTPEIATINGYDKDDIRLISNEVQNVILNLLETIRTEGDEFLSNPVISRFIETVNQNTERVKDFFEDYTKDYDIENAFEDFIDEYKWVYIVLKGKNEEDANRHIVNLEKNLRNRLNDLNKLHDQKNKRRKEKYMSSASKQQMTNEADENQQSIINKRKLEFYQNAVTKLNTIFNKNPDIVNLKAYEIFKKDFDRIIQRDNVLPPVVDFFVKNPNTISVVITENVQDKIKGIKGAPNINQNIINAIQDVANVNRNAINDNKMMQMIQLAPKRYAQIYAKFNHLPYDISSYEINCESNQVKGLFQFTYQFPLSSFINLFEYYASTYGGIYTEDLLDDYDMEYDDEDASSSMYTKNYIMVRLFKLIRMSECILYFKNCGDLIMRLNPKIQQLWTKDVYGKITKYIQQETSDKNAVGLFYLYLTYAFQLFKRSSENIEQKEEKALDYGPKQLLDIMSRISFSEMFDKLDLIQGSKQAANCFKKLIEIFCNTDNNLTNNESVCDNIFLVQHDIYAGFNYPKDTQIQEPLSLLKWSRSIVFANERYPIDQPKVDIKKKLEQGLNGDIVSHYQTDHLSPPITYSRYLIPKYRRTDEEDIQNHSFKAIYSMGAYTNVDPGVIIAEFRSYSGFDVYAENIGNFIEEFGLSLFKVLDKEIVSSQQQEQLQQQRLLV